jgi:hypothetical protein
MVVGAAGAAGLPAHGPRGAIAVLLAGVLQALAGVWLGRVLAARRASRAAVQVSDAPTHRGDETMDLVRLLDGPGRPSLDRPAGLP